MSQKRKSGLQRGLSEIVERQTAPVEDKSRLSRGLIDKFSEPRESSPAIPTTATQSTQRTHSTQGTQGRKSPTKPLPPQPTAQPVAPARDFMKVANSIGREAVPAGVFTGKGKQIYDYLYSKTRGAITPVRSAQLTRKEIMMGAHIGSDKTLRENLLRLRHAGLINWDGSENVGAHAGNLYTVYLPEEAKERLATLGTQGTLGRYGQFLPIVPSVESTLGTQGLSVEDEATSGEPKTFNKTKDRSDDEALADFNSIFRKLTADLTGRDPSKADAARWRELAEVIAAEARIAAARTTVSNVPAFLAEHLRRRLWKIDKRQAQAEGRELPDQAASTPAESPQNCPDCKGSGWWYPQGQEKGVAKCRHERLASG